jgi:hypothetical protein
MFSAVLLKSFVVELLVVVFRSLKFGAKTLAKGPEPPGDPEAANEDS